MNYFEKLAADEGWSAEGKDMLKSYLLNGLSIGGGAALLTSLINYLRHVSKPKHTSDEDDDTIYVFRNPNAPMNKTASDDEDSTMWERGVSMSGGVASALLGYALVKKLYSKLRAAQAQEELDKAQRIFLNESGYEVADKKGLKKNASFKDTWDKATGAVMAAPILLALGSAMATNAILESKYPAKSDKKVKAPKRIKIIDKPEDDQDEYMKMASAEIEEEARELVMRTATLNPVENSDFNDLLAACANGRHEEIKKVAQAIGFGPALSIVKGASAHPVSELNKHIAIGWLAKDPYMGPSSSLLAAGEFVEQYPNYFKKAAAYTGKAKEGLFKAAICLNKILRQQLSTDLGIRFEDTGIQEKSASWKPGTADYLSKVLSDLNGGLRNAEPMTKGDDRESTETSSTQAGIYNPDSASQPTDAKKTAFITASHTARRNANDLPTDDIDRFLTGDPQQPVQRPST